MSSELSVKQNPKSLDGISGSLTDGSRRVKFARSVAFDGAN
ncbi:hypothetical protein CKA32_000570 [Geitlerinema sp. FC II]|nr:hypothetical protein CKA32_000553 [Geitlerinema sp. FC II]PPT11266.1 hypothetical protein CKA32_000550 [Geitlerinema sp. FC II]PPT11303.1 hypothetical protein CKA32_000570 [Geitlerinema sp. FC II]